MRFKVAKVIAWLSEDGFSAVLPRMVAAKPRISIEAHIEDIFDAVAGSITVFQFEA